MSKNKKQIWVKYGSRFYRLWSVVNVVNRDCDDFLIECKCCLKWIHAGCSGLKQSEISKVVTDSTKSVTIAL